MRLACGHRPTTPRCVTLQRVSTSITPPCLTSPPATHQTAKDPMKRCPAPERTWRRASSTVLVVVVLVSAVFMTGCAGETGAEPLATSSRSMPTTSPSQPQRTADATPGVTMPDGYVWRQVPSHQLEFAAPKPWTPLDPAELQGLAAADIPAEVSELAAQLGISPEQFITSLDRSSLLLVASPDSAANITVAEVPGDSTPPADQIQKALGAVGATASSAQESVTRVGPAVRVDYGVDVELDDDAGQSLRVSGAQTIVDTGDGVLQFTVTARDAQRAADITDELLGTLRRSG